MKEYYLGREYGVLPKWMQFIIFIHQGLFGGGGGKWRMRKLKRINCWFGKHTYPTEYNGNIKIQQFVRDRCIECGYTNTCNHYKLRV